MAMPNSPALRRVHRDLRDMDLDIPVTVGFKNGSDLSHILVNFLPTEGRYAGQPVHVHIDVPPDYPTQPLEVSIHTEGFSHPNVFDGYICLDMLKPPEHHAAPYTGWSAAYSLSSVIMQLYGFLLVDDKVEQMGGYVHDIKNDRYGYSHEYTRLPPTVTCRCGFTELPAAPAAAAAARAPEAGVPELPRDILDDILGRTNGTTLAKLALNGSTDPLAQSAREAKQRAETKCFFSKESPFEDPAQMLGMCVTAERRDQRHGGERVNLSITPGDKLSLKAFQSGVRLTAWNIPFTAFLPVIINADHAERALDALPQCLRAMMAAGQNPADPAALLDVIARLFNGLVVELTQSRSDGNRIARHMSDAALETFCHLHHLLVAVVVRRHPGIADACTRDVLRFVQDPAARRKAACPDLGLLLVKYMLVPMDRVRWSDFASAYLREALARHVMWVRAPGWFTAPTRAERDDARLKAHLDGALVSLRLICLMAFFANALARPSSEATKARELHNIEAAYNGSNGDPPPRVADLFYGHARGVMSISSWTHVLSLLRLRLNAPGAADPAAKTRAFADMLRQAVVDSSDAGYHRAPRGWVRTAFHGWTPSPLASV